MKRIILFFFLFAANTNFAANISLDNKISNSHDGHIRKIAIQWAASVKNIDETNNKIKQGVKLNSKNLYILNHTGKIHLDTPKKAEYFRILVWSHNKKQPDFLTNWVDIIPNKTYTLNQDHLIPIVLMSGTGC